MSIDPIIQQLAVELAPTGQTCEILHIHDAKEKDDSDLTVLLTGRNAHLISSSGHHRAGEQMTEWNSHPIIGNDHLTRWNDRSNDRTPTGNDHLKDHTPTGNDHSTAPTLHWIQPTSDDFAEKLSTFLVSNSRCVIAVSLDPPANISQLEHPLKKLRSSVLVLRLPRSELYSVQPKKHPVVIIAQTEMSEVYVKCPDCPLRKFGRLRNSEDTGRILHCCNPLEGRSMTVGYIGHAPVIIEPESKLGKEIGLKEKPGGVDPFYAELFAKKYNFHIKYIPGISYPATLSKVH